MNSPSQMKEPIRPFVTPRVAARAVPAAVVAYVQRQATKKIPSWRKKRRIAAVRSFFGCVLLAALCGCGVYHSPWREQRLPSGRHVKVTSFNLVWGAEHDDHALGGDCFSIEYVTTKPEADPKTRAQEAVEVFELIRPVAELWGFKSAELAGFPTVVRKGHYDFYLFVRGANGEWSFTVEPRKVFAND
jgi:hypothetical protein